MTGKTFTPAEIRQLITDLRQEHLISAREWGEEDASKISTAASRGADALEYLLQFVEWKPADEAPDTGDLAMILLNGQMNFCRVRDMYLYDVTRFLILPPPPQEKDCEQ